MKYSIIFLFSFCFLFFQCSKNQDAFSPVTENDIVFVGTGSGCVDFLVYKLNEDKNIGLSVEGIKQALFLTQDEKTYDLLTEQHLSIKIENLSNGNNYYCDDVLESYETVLNTYESVSGIVKVQITEDSIDYSNNIPSIQEELYKINVFLEDVILEDAQGNKLMIKEERFIDVLVGWFPG